MRLSRRHSLSGALRRSLLIGCQQVIYMLASCLLSFIDKHWQACLSRVKRANNRNALPLKDQCLQSQWWKNEHCLLPPRSLCSSAPTSTPTCSLTWLTSAAWLQPKPSPLLLITPTWSPRRRTNLCVESGTTHTPVQLSGKTKEQEKRGGVGNSFQVCYICRVHALGKGTKENL